jgi:peptide/nickel transport system substrate-binding protein
MDLAIGTRDSNDSISQFERVVMVSRHAQRLIAFLLVLLPFVVACGGDEGSLDAAPEEEGDSDVGSDQAGEPERGGELDVLMILDTTSEAAYDPVMGTEQTQWVIAYAIFDTLVEITPDEDIIPKLATSWDVSDDGLEYTLQIQEGVLFHDGSPLTAEDVRYSLERILDPEIGSPRRTLFNKLGSVTAPDEHTVVLQLSAPWTAIMAALSHPTASIVPSGAADSGDFGRNPIGTGPFVFSDWVRDQRIVVEANQQYWRDDRPYLDRIVFTFNSDSSARLALLRSGDVDFLFNAPAEGVEIVAGDEGIVVHGEDGLSFHYMVMNPEHPPFDDARVRQAIFAALDREALAQAGMGEQHATALPGGYLPSTHWAGLTEPVWVQDYDRARQLLVEAGLEEGFSFDLLALSGWDFQIRTMVALKEQLEPLGITANVQVVEPGVLVAAAVAQDYEAIGWSFSPTFDPDERFQQTFVSAGNVNWGKTADPEIDELAAKAGASLDRDERATLYRQAQVRLAEEGTYAFLYNFNNYDLLNRSVKGYTYSPLFTYYSFSEIWISED